MQGFRRGTDFGVGKTQNDARYRCATKFKGYGPQSANVWNQETFRLSRRRAQLVLKRIPSRSGSSREDSRP